MKQGKTLVQLAQELERIQSTKKDFMVPTSMLKMEENGNLSFTNGEKHEFGLNSWSSSQVASYSDVPKAYFDRLSKENVALLSKNVNHGFQQATQGKDRESRMVRTLDGHVRGFLSSRYRTLDAHDLLENTLPVLLDGQFNVLSSEVTEKRLYLKTASPKIEGQVKVNDVVQYGVMLSTSDVGAGSLRVEPFFYRLACANGMIMETKFRKAHLGSNNFESAVQELLSDNTKRLNDQAFFATVRDYLKATMAPESFERELNKMRAAADRKITNFDLEQVVELTAREVGIVGEKTKRSILAALASGNEGAGLTQWGLANSFTRAAHDAEIDYDTSTDLERAGGAVLDLAPSAWKRVAEVA